MKEEEEMKKKPEFSAVILLFKLESLKVNKNNS
jgi:hypothetical protein